ncbi:MAG: hypothetical protein B7Y39_18985 [Bdellovibrio sp. 28-41-41]|nr:MAG: hypothetical protein B7Y39_18985 [Bdellovibrio sp. 28-41-41]
MKYANNSISTRYGIHGFTKFITINELIEKYTKLPFQRKLSKISNLLIGLKNFICFVSKSLWAIFFGSCQINDRITEQKLKYKTYYLRQMS